MKNEKDENKKILFDEITTSALYSTHLRKSSQQKSGENLEPVATGPPPSFPQIKTKN